MANEKKDNCIKNPLSNPEDGESLKFLKEKHAIYCIRTLQVLPQRCETFDSTRLVIAFFAISTLDLLNSLSKIEKERKIYIDWIYQLQITSPGNSSPDVVCGFRGSTSCSMQDDNDFNIEYCDQPSLATTYAALASLLVLGDNLERVDKKGTVTSLRKFQLPDGSFRAMYSESENDMRFVYCASCISYILQDWSGMDTDKAIQYIQESITYEGGIAQGPGLEAHGGSTFCAVASLWLMGKLQCSLTHEQLKSLKRWCLFRQVNGFQGRPNKPSDTCYSFWIGATLNLLDSYHLFNHDELRQYILRAQDVSTGGIPKWEEYTPDPLHTFLGIGGLSLIERDGIVPVHPALNISQKAAAHLASLHESWREKSEPISSNEMR